MEEIRMPKVPDEHHEDIDREAHEMFIEYAVNQLQEALHIKGALETIIKQIENGTLNKNMTVGEMLEALTQRVAELTGEIEEEN